MEARFERTLSPKAKPDDNNLGFGKYFTDHMFLMDYEREMGWHDARIVPFGNLSLHPACTALHYGAEVFEGLKAYHGVDGKLRLFRPWDNIARMNDSCERLCLPQLEPESALQMLYQYVDTEREWVPKAPGTSLYLRPFLFGNDPFLGLHTINRALYSVIASPSGSYYKEGLKPVSIMIEEKDVRAVRGGTGYAKCGGNYAASNRAGAKAEQEGFSQVLWLDGVERKYVEEVGAMNVMFKIAGKILTPSLLGSVLPGITRRSCIQLLKEKGFEVEERQVSAAELFTAMRDGTLEEAWGCGTAAVVSPIGLLSFMGEKGVISGGKIGEVTQWLYDTLTGIQFGRVPDTYGWTKEL